MSDITITPITEGHWPAVWAILEPMIRAGETYPYAMDMTQTGAKATWMHAQKRSYVAISEGRVLGTYYIRPNQPSLGAHVANAGYVTSAAARGRGLGRQMCQHSQDEARRYGYRAMQYNLVAADNAAAVYLWQDCGFNIVGTLPGAFHRRAETYVDAYVMYKRL